jgi:trk system potassium uptake protein TrkA
MHIVIVGAGRVGFSLARWLVSSGHEIAVVDEDRASCSALEEALGGVSVVGGGADPGALAKAGANRAEVLIATSGRDEVNLAACQLAKHSFGVSRTISVINRGDHAELFGLLGVDVTVDATEIVLGRIQEGMSSHGLVHLKPVSGGDGKSLVAIRIPSESGMVGRPIRDISLPNGTVISLVISRDGDVAIPSDGTVIRAGDEVIAVTSAQEEEELRDLLVEGPSQ